MRSAIFLLIFSLLVATTHAQEMKPEIVGQKDLSTEQGKAITIELTDLYVDETPVQSDDEDNGGGGGHDDDDDNGESDDDNGKSDDEEDEDDAGEDNKDDDGEDDENTDDGGDNNGDDDDGDEENGNGGHDDKKDGKDKKNDKDKKDDKGNGGDKGDKGKKGDNKGKGSNERVTYPEGYTLELFPGENYTFTANTVLPDAGFSGIIIIPVRVKNASHASPKYDLKLTVTPSAVAPNHPPVIIGQSPLNTPMDTPLTIKASDLQVTDPDDQYPAGFTLTLQPGKNYQVHALTITPSAGFSGALTVPVTVNDGESNSSAFNLLITVTEAAHANVPPRITGQLLLSISVNQSLKIVLSQLLVSDPDNEFPSDFILKVFPGSDYSVDGTTVTPKPEFTGDLSVNVSVSDGVDESEVFPMKITVTGGVNVKPAITGQVGLKIPQGENLEIKLPYLVVEDPDNRYPEDFTLIVSSGDNYSVSNKVVTPDKDFLGMLTARVSVNDGKTSSDPFELKIEVISRDKLEIVGQKAISIREDSSVVVGLDYLIVNDPSHRYPQGFTLDIGASEHHEVSGNRIVPVRDFSGNLTVSVTVRQGAISSAPFLLLIVVDPVNDPPELINLPSDALVVNRTGTWPVFADASIVDVDDEYLLFAEVGFRDRIFNPRSDKIAFKPVGKLHAVFDESKGVLYVVGRGALDEYQELIQSVIYDFDASQDASLSAPRHIYMKLNDGKSTSMQYERMLMFDIGVKLEIPTAFTPNNDNANDTWTIMPLQEGEQINTFVRVYDKKGNMVFESSNLDHAWDGLYNGSPLPADVYFYTIEMDLSYRKISYKGVVSILR